MKETDKEGVREEEEEEEKLKGGMEETRIERQERKERRQRKESKRWKGLGTQN